MESGINGFEGVVEHHQKMIYSLAFRMVGNHADADSLAQETFFKAYRNLDGFRGGSSIGTWLWRIASHTCIDFLKKRQRRREVLEPNGMWKAVDGADPSLDAQAEERRDIVRRTLCDLEPEDRAMITLTAMEGVSHRETADILGIPAGTVSWRVLEIKKKLANSLSKYLVEE